MAARAMQRWALPRFHVKHKNSKIGATINRTFVKKQNNKKTTNPAPRKMREGLHWGNPSTITVTANWTAGMLRTLEWAFQYTVLEQNATPEDEAGEK